MAINYDDEEEDDEGECTMDQIGGFRRVVVKTAACLLFGYRATFFTF